MKETIHLHRDIELLEGNFKSKFGVPIKIDKHRLFGYFLQGANIVRMAYNHIEAKSFLNRYNGEKIEPIYYYDNIKHKKEDSL